MFSSRLGGLVTVTRANRITDTRGGCIPILPHRRSIRGHIIVVRVLLLGGFSPRNVCIRWLVCTAGEWLLGTAGEWLLGTDGEGVILINWLRCGP